MTETEKSQRPYQDRANGIVLRFGYPADSSVEVRYKRFDLFTSGWKEGHQQRSLVLTFNDQCFVADTVMELKQAADALAISFGDEPTLEVQATVERLALGGNWFDLANAAAEKLGWKLIHPIFTIPAQEDMGWSLH